MTEQHLRILRELHSAILSMEKAMETARSSGALTSLHALLSRAPDTGGAMLPSVQLSHGRVITSGMSLPQCGVFARHQQQHDAAALRAAGWRKRRHMVKGVRINRWYAPDHGPL